VNLKNYHITVLNNPKTHLKIIDGITFHRDLGVTLIEILVVVTIIAIIASMAVPMNDDYSVRKKIESVFWNFRSDLSFSRNKARVTRLPMVICPKDEGSINPICGSDWTAGWLIFQDVNRDNNYDDDIDLLFRNQKKLDERIKIVVPEEFDSYILFSRSGNIHSDTTEKIIFCDHNNTEGSTKVVAVYVTGYGGEIDVDDSSTEQCESS